MDGTSPVLLSISYGNSNNYIPVGSTRIKANQWDSKRKKVVNHPHASTINGTLSSILGRAEDAVLELTREGGVRGWSFKQVCDAVIDYVFPGQDSDDSLLSVMERFMSTKEKPNTKDKYRQTITHIERWLGAGARRVEFADVTPAWLERFEAYMVKVGLGTSSRSIHMRNLRTVFNWALENDLTQAPYPFRKFKIKAAKTEPLALTLEQLRLLWNYVPEPGFEGQRYWLDIWKIIFGLIGINMVDLCNLEKMTQGRVNYMRSKTGRSYSVKVEPEIAELLARHKGRGHFVDILNRMTDVKNATLAINRRIKEIAEKLGLPPMTAYTARYTWASLAASIDIPIEVISQALGHSYGLAVTLGYIMPDRRKVDEANRKVLDLLK
jgi:integrase